VRSVLVSAVGSIAARSAQILRSPLLVVGVSAFLFSACAAETSKESGVRPVRAHISRPAPSLLTPPTEPACSPSASGSRAETRPPQHEAGSEKSDADASLSQRVRLEFERNCFRQAELRTRTQLLELQAAVGKTIRSIDRMKPGELTGKP
jgi:hypothetical protein